MSIVPQGLPLKPAEREAIIRRRMWPGAMGGQTRAVGPTGRPKDKTSQYRPPATGGFLPPRTVRWETVPTISGLHTFDFSAGNVTSSVGDQSWYSYGTSPGPYLVLAAGGMYSVTVDAQTAAASLVNVDHASLVFGAAGAPDANLTFATAAFGGQFYGAGTRLIVTDAGGGYRITVTLDGGGASGVMVTATKIG